MLPDRVSSSFPALRGPAGGARHGFDPHGGRSGCVPGRGRTSSPRRFRHPRGFGGQPPPFPAPDHRPPSARDPGSHFDRCRRHCPSSGPPGHRPGSRRGARPGSQPRFRPAPWQYPCFVREARRVSAQVLDSRSPRGPAPPRSTPSRLSLSPVLSPHLHPLLAGGCPGRDGRGMSFHWRGAAGVAMSSPVPSLLSSHDSPLDGGRYPAWREKVVSPPSSPILSDAALSLRWPSRRRRGLRYSLSPRRRGPRAWASEFRGFFSRCPPTSPRVGRCQMPERHTSTRVGRCQMSRSSTTCLPVSEVPGSGCVGTCQMSERTPKNTHLHVPGDVKYLGDMNGKRPGWDGTPRLGPDTDPLVFPSGRVQRSDPVT